MDWTVRSVLKHLGVFALKYTGVLRVARRISTSRGFLIIGWHGVSLEDEHDYFHTLFISPTQLERRLKFLSKVMSIVSLEEALRQKESGSIAPSQVVLTFDDGYYNYKQAALPVLRRYNAPSVNYVVSARMLDGRSKPNLVLRDCIYRTVKQQLDVEKLAGISSVVLGEEEAKPLSLDGAKNRKKVEKLLLSRLEEIPESEQDAFVDRIGHALQMDVDKLRKRRFWTSLSPSEVHELVHSSDQVSIQLHSHRHHNSVELGDRLSEDLRQCRAAIEEASGKTAADFCYPTGFWTKATWHALTENEVRSAVTTRRGPNFVETHNYSLRRVMDGGANSQLEFEFEVSGIKWLINSWLNPESRVNPSEKTARYRDSAIRY